MGDGICCDNGSGNYSISLDGNLLKTGDDFGFEEQTVFDVGPPGPSFSPTPAPTCRSDGDSCLLGNQCCSGRCRSYICSDSLDIWANYSNGLKCWNACFMGMIL